jgi:hypothetical protein
MVISIDHDNLFIHPGEHAIPIFLDQNRILYTSGALSRKDHLGFNRQRHPF